MENQEMKIYFAYGSNLCLKRFHDPSRVPSASFISIATLDGYRVVFHKRSNDGSGKATIIRDSDSKVVGALFSYAEEHHARLKKVESGYQEQRVVVSTPGGRIDAETFICKPTEFDRSLQPYDWYVDLIRFGGRRLGLPEDYLSQFDTVITKTDADTDRVARERAFLQ